MAAAASSSSSSKAPAEKKSAPSGTELRPILQNVVGTCEAGCQVDLKQVALKSRNAEYNPKKFSAVVMRIREPKTTALIFSSGKIVITGAKSEAKCQLGAFFLPNFFPQFDLMC